MIHAYDKVYLDKARTALGRMLDYATYDLQYETGAFFDLFISSGIADRFGAGDFTVIVGKSGVELARLVLDESKIETVRTPPRYAENRSEEYWTGWALAYYQWNTALSFKEIVTYIPIDNITKLYSPYHEMDIHHFCDKMDTLYRTANPETKLKILRQRAGLTQHELAEVSGIPVRTIQQYEQRQKSINKAQAERLASLANVLCCDIEDLLEKIE